MTRIYFFPRKLPMLSYGVGVFCTWLCAFVCRPTTIPPTSSKYPSKFIISCLLLSPNISPKHQS